MPPRSRLTAADVRQYAVRKRPAQGAGPSRPPKRPQVAPSGEPTGSGAEPVIALSAPTVLVEVPSEGPSGEGAASPERRAAEESVSAPAAQPVEEEQEEAREPERPAPAVAAPSGETRSGSSLPSTSDIRTWMSGRGKAPMSSDDEGRSAGGGGPTDFPLPEGASGLANHDLARRLCQALLLPADIEAMKNQRVSDMLSSFYPMMIRLVYNISELETGYRRFGDLRAAWRDKVAAAEADRVILVDQLQQSVDREGRLEGEVSRLTEEVSRLTGALATSESELQSIWDDAKKKSRTVCRLRHERDSFAKELKAEREQLRVSLENLVKAEEGLSIAQADADIARAEAESVKEALGRAVEDFRDSKEYREELLESGFLSYRVGYEDAREAVRSLYPELDLGIIIPPETEAPAAEETADPSPGGLTTMAEAEAEAEQATEGQAAPTPEVRSVRRPSTAVVQWKKPTLRISRFFAFPLLLLVILVSGLWPSFVNLSRTSMKLKTKSFGLELFFFVKCLSSFMCRGVPRNT
ncbi:uncharacterized protein [Elaeis guineensis]|uniref:uncharacterized protein n=1 Tax=Elaeis guineensis var. tenera TaxID=51953 RepID=UPI003C6D57C6